MSQKIIYVAGFRQHAGKTTGSLGLIHTLLSKYSADEIGYIKPVGQEMFTLPSGEKIDKDAVLIQKFFLPNLDLKNVSPVKIGSGVTKDYLSSDDRNAKTLEFINNIKSAIESMKDKKVIIAEGTGHPGVGNIVGLSNAHVSRLLKAPIIYIAGGGIGKSLDMLATDLSFFAAGNAEVRGVIFNKLFPSKLEDSKFYLSEPAVNSIFPEHNDNLNILGYMPELKYLNKPSMRIFLNKFKNANPINDTSHQNWSRSCNKVKMISLPNRFFDPETFLNSRDVVIISSASKRRLKKIVKYNDSLENKLAGIILTCSTIPTNTRQFHEKLFKNSSLAAMYVDVDSSDADLIIDTCIKNTKIQPYDANKIEKIKKLYDDHFDKEKFFKMFDL